jgi:hypothetical protein
MFRDRIKSTVETVENVIGYQFVYKDKCNGCLSLDYRFYNEPKIIVKASFCKMLSYNRDILKHCPCVECLVKLMCSTKQKETCHLIREFLEGLTNAK